MTRTWLFLCAAVLCLAACGSPAPTSNNLTLFKVAGEDGTIGADSVDVVVPAGTNLTALVAAFQTTGTRVEVGGIEQISGQTANNFTAPLTYTVIAGNGAKHDYRVSVTVGASSAKDLVTFVFLDANNADLSADVTATINGGLVAATVPFGTNVSALIATFTHTGTGVTVAGAPQASGTTANDFGSAVVYQVTAADGTMRDYTVTVTVAQSPAKDITAFAFLDAGNPALTADVIATINGTQIAAMVPFGTNVTALVATFTTTGASVRVGGLNQTSGTTPNSFAGPAQYTVVAADGTTKAYTVTVTVAPANAKDITAFSFLDTTNAALSADVIATINGTAIEATVPFGTDITALVATFAHDGVSVAVGATSQVSGTTANDFSSPVQYVVTAGDTTTKTYTVTVTSAANPAKDITAFSFLDATNIALSVDVVATINGTSIHAFVPFGTDMTALVATFSHTGASVTVGATTQLSNVTVNDFTNPVAYVVHALDGSTKTYNVSVQTKQRYVMPVVRTSYQLAESPVTTIVRAEYAALTSPTSANIEVRIIDSAGAPLMGPGGAICNPCAGTVTAANRAFVLDLKTVATAVGFTASMDASVLVDVWGDADRVAVSATTETAPGASPNKMIDAVPIVKETVHSAYNVLLGPGVVDNDSIADLGGGPDVRIFLINTGGDTWPAGNITLWLYDPNTGGILVDGASAVCNPCNFSVGGASGFARTQVIVDNLRFNVGGTGVREFMGVLDITGPGADRTYVVAQTERSTNSSPRVVQRTELPTYVDEPTASPTKVFVTTEFGTSVFGTETVEVSSFAGLGMPTPPTATVAHKVYNSATGAMQLGNSGQAICNPSCGGTLGAGVQIQRSTLPAMAAPQGGLQTPASTFMVTTVDGTAAGNVFVTKRTQIGGRRVEARVRVPAMPPSRAFVLPHVFETIGTVDNAQNTFDSILFLAYTGGLPTGTGTGARVDLYLFDQSTGRVMQGLTGPVCNPCTMMLSTSNRKATIRIDDLITGNGGGFDTNTKAGFGVVVLSGSDPDGVSLQFYLANEASGAGGDPAVFGFEPQPIAAAP